MQRTVLGLIALGLFVAGSLGTFTEVFGADSVWWGGVSLRAGAILGVSWLVMPKARHVPRYLWVGLGIFAGVLAFRPRLVLFGIVLSFTAMVVVALAQRRAATSKGSRR
jgi:hypothetical protein